MGRAVAAILLPPPFHAVPDGHRIALACAAYPPSFLVQLLDLLGHCLDLLQRGSRAKQHPLSCAWLDTAEHAVGVRRAREVEREPFHLRSRALGRMEASTETPRKRKRSGEAGPSTDLVAAPKSSSAPRLRVSFGSVRVRTHDVEIWGGGGVPADDGPPLGLGWNVQGEEIFALDAFESERKGSRITKTKREERRGEDSRGEERS